MTQTMTVDYDPRPFVKWPGGKGKLVGELMARMPREIGTYHEPFVGGGALFFALGIRRARLTDLNDDLINAYRVIRDQIEPLIADLKKHEYSAAYYYKIRAKDDPLYLAQFDDVQRASRLIYLAKTCFNGLYRLNGSGQFNSPIGRHKNPTICDENLLYSCRAALQGVELSVTDFLDIEVTAQPGDLVYFDPPYIPLNATSSFTSYTQDGFSVGQHTLLRDCCQRLSDKGVLFMLSNSYSPLARKLYEGFTQEVVYAPRSINAKADKRGKIPELLIRNY